MTIKEIEARLAELAKEVEAEGADLDAIEEEVRSLKEQKAEIEAAAEKRAKIVEDVKGLQASPVKVFAEPKTDERKGADSVEYRNAFLKNLAVRDGRSLFGEMTREERVAYTHTTANSGNVVPTGMLNKIIELVESQAPMYADAEKSGLVQGFGVPRHSAIAAGDASGVSEGTAPSNDEQDTFTLLPLDGIEIKKDIVISRKMKFQSIDAFEAWVNQHLADRIAAAKEAIILARLDGSAPAGGSAVAAAAIAAGNVLTSQTYGDPAIRNIFGLLHGVGERVIYANQATIWNYLTAITDSEGHNLFIPNGMSDPIVQGRIYGAEVKVNNALSNNVVYAGIKGQVLANDFDELEIFNSIDSKSAASIVLGYSLFDAGLQNPKGFVKATFTVSA